MNVSKAKVEEGKLKVTGRELTYYLDPTTGEKLDRWDNPWTEEKDLPVVHIANDPVQMALPSFIPLETRENKYNNTTTIVSEVNYITVYLLFLRVTNFFLLLDSFILS